MTDLPAGWYDDGSGHQRWWTGQGWSEQVQEPTAPKRRPKWPWIVGGSALLLIALGVGGVVLLISWIAGLSTAPGTPSAAVLSFNQAIADEDCETFFTVTSDGFREASGIDGCDVFSQGAAITNETATDRTVDISGFQSVNSDATVTTRESLVDEDGELVEAHRTYTLHAIDGQWQVVDVTTD
jgi:hypothetical protein